MRRPGGKTSLLWLLALAFPFALIALLEFTLGNAPAIPPQCQFHAAQFVESDAAEPGALPREGWQSTQLPRRVDTSRTQPSSAWFRVPFTAERPGREPWAVYLPRPYSNVEVYVNGAKVGDGGPMQSPIPVLRGPVLFTFPSQLLKPGDNLMEVRSMHPYLQPRLGVVSVGPRAQLLPNYEFTLAFAVTARQVSVVVLVVLALLFGALWALRREETGYAWFALGLLAWAAHIQILLVPRAPFDNPVLWQNLQGIAIGVFALTSALFVNRFTGLRQPRVERGIAVAWLLGALVLLADATWWGYSLPWFGRLVWIPALILITAYTVVQLVRSLARGITTEVAVLAAAGWLALVVSARDMLIEIDRLSGRLYLSYTVGFVLCAVAAVLLIRFARAFRLAERARDELDERVREKTAELEHNLVRVKDLEREQALSSERERILQDMHDGLGGHLVQALAIATSSDSLRPVEEPLRACLDELRLMVDSLEPVNGDLAGVLGTLRPRISRRLALAGVNMRWQVDDLPPLPDLGPRKVLDVARVVQEAITNALKHSGCRLITVSAKLGGGPDAIEILVEDDGAGIQPGGLGRGHGLSNMTRRAAALGGSVTVANASPGTRVSLHLPLSANRKAGREQSPDQVRAATGRAEHSDA